MIVGILLAAGLGRRIGTPKALIEVTGETFYARALRVFSEAALNVIVVTNTIVVSALETPSSGEILVVNPDPDQAGGMFSSVRLGVAEAIARGATGAVLLPVDHPLVAAADISTVARELAAGANIVVPVHQGRRGHPIGISRNVMDEIMAESDLKTLRDVVRKDRSRLREIEGSAGILTGVNTQQDLERVLNARFR